ncbi:M23 family metallopeptidase [Streptomyces qinzhouensis]|uniref:M23 family metallopeptidase n=1 Tax=Streptomyces qinzhouensis TaxID=2599401 RepID=UPI001644D4D0|nr:M23 family metallopeptidase [Streptomyces qinzhouensis]
MNDQHAHAGYVGHDTYPTGSYDTDPLFGALPESGTDHGAHYDAAQWDTGSQQTAAAQYSGYDSYGTGVYEAPGADPAAGDTSRAEGSGGGYESTYGTTGQWDAAAWTRSADAAAQDPAAAYAYDNTGSWGAPSFESGAYDATAWNTAAADAEPLPLVPQQYAPEQELPGTHQDFPAQDFPAQDFAAQEFGTQEFGPELMDRLAQPLDTEADATAVVPVVDEDLIPHHGESGPGHDGPREHQGDEDEHAYGSITGVAPVTPRPVRRAGNGGRGRRRTPAKRSALLTVAVPSACVMGVAGIAAASVGDIGAEPKQKEDTTTLAAADTSMEQIAANSRMDTQLAALSAEARDFGDRASRTQERIDLKARQEAERQKREEEAKKREALRPKFALPVQQKGLSTYYGQSGVNWMALHTGIDFPVDYGTEVMAATDGTVRTQFNRAYGNMVILTAPDGTETWYCHLASSKVRYGKVKAGDVIGYAGDSGNSTGPHLHFEVRPNGGSHVNPLVWLQSKGLNPV